jgi:undecaprenyl-diphosphatase
MPQKLLQIAFKIIDSVFKFLKQQPIMLIIIMACFFAFSFFGEVVDEVLEGESHALDEKILLYLRDKDDIKSPLGPPWLEEMMRDFTALGGIGLLTFMTLASTVYLIIIKRKFHAIYLVIVIITGTILSNLLKIGFDRPRPDLVPHDSITYMAGFPSGHSFMATVVYLTLGVILTEAQTKTGLKFYFLFLAVLLAILVGVSRVYLGVHWPSDVLAGWLIGAGWALLFWILAKFMQNYKSSNV